MGKQIISLGIVAIGLLLFSSCSIFKKGHKSNLENKTWTLVSLASGCVLPTEKKLTVHFNSERHELIAQSGCNSINGIYSINKSYIKCDRIARTYRNCQYFKIEKELIDVFKNANGYKMKNGQLQLLNKDKVLAVFS